jgi:Zn-dependent protease
MDRIWQWSLPLFRIRGIQVYAHWSLTIIMVFYAIRFLRDGGSAWLTPLIMAIVFLAVFLHELGHAFTSRAMGGRCDGIVLWMLGGITEYEGPRRPWPQFAITSAGVLVNGVLAALAYALLYFGRTHGWLSANTALCLGFLYQINLIMVLFNLLPCYPLDGGRMLLAAMWGLIGYRRGIVATLFISIPCSAALIGWAIWDAQLLLAFLGVWLFSTAIQEYRNWKQGGAVFGMDVYSYSGPSNNGREISWFAAWKMRRQKKAAAKTQKAENDEQEHIDQLLAKVGDSGLASLTKKERATLEAYSRKQRERLEA